MTEDEHSKLEKFIAGLRRRGFVGDYVKEQALAKVEEICPRKTALGRARQFIEAYEVFFLHIEILADRPEVD